MTDSSIALQRLLDKYRAELNLSEAEWAEAHALAADMSPWLHRDETSKRAAIDADDAR